MCYILRHEAAKYNLTVDKEGFISISDLLNCEPIKKLKISKNIIQKIVESDEKGRYQIAEDKIRCVQGHSMKEVDVEESCEQLTNIFDYPLVVHGSYKDAWDSIKNSGLNKMKRNAIHFSIGYPKDENVKSGMRADCNIFIELNLIHAFYNGHKFLISKNNVILGPGRTENGAIEPKFLKLVCNRDGEVLMSQKYQIVVFLNLSKPTKEIKLFLKEAIFLDLENKKLLHHMPFEIGKDDLNLDQVTEYIFEKKLLEKTLSFNVSSKELFLDMLRNKDNTFKNKGLYNDFLVKPFAIVVDDVELFFQKN